MQTGDMLFCYSNGLTEFPDAAGRTIGLAGLQELARELSQTQGPPHAIQAQLRRIFDQAGADAEDLTLVLAKATGTRVSLRDDCLALLRCYAASMIARSYSDKLSSFRLEGRQIEELLIMGNHASPRTDPVGSANQ